MDSERAAAFEKRWSLVGSGLTWFYVHNLLVTAGTVPDALQGIPGHLVGAFTEQLKLALNDYQRLQEDEERNWMRTAINATGLTWYHVYITLLGMQFAFLAPPPDTDSKTDKSITSQAMSDLVRTFTDQLGFSLLDWGVLPVEEYRRQRKESLQTAMEIIEDRLKKWHAVPPFPPMRTD